MLAGRILQIILPPRYESAIGGVMIDVCKHVRKENERLRHELAMHKDDDSTKECPGCYMERLWEKQLENKDKQIKSLEGLVHKLSK